MGMLLLLVGLLAVVSGGFKLRERARALFGQSGLAMVEMVLGAATILGSGMGLSRVRLLAWAVVVGMLGLIVVSLLVHARHIVRHRKRREESEAARLREYLESGR